MLKTVLGVLAALVLAAPAHAVNVSWVDWQSRNGTTVDGVLTVGLETINVQFTTTAVGIFGVQTNGGIDYWQNNRAGRSPATSPYTSVGPKGNDNIPTGTDIVQLSFEGTHTLTFDKPITDIYMSFVSINGNTYDFGANEIQLLSATRMNIDGNGIDDGGYWGAGTPLINGPAPWTMFGSGEAHGTLLLPGTFSSLSWTTTREFWHGFTIGIEGVATPRVPLPAAGWLAIAGLGALGGLKRLRRR